MWEGEILLATDGVVLVCAGGGDGTGCLFSSVSRLPPRRSGRVFLDESDHFFQKDGGPLSEGFVFREGKAEGKTVTRFEFLAVLDGLEAVAAADKSGLPIQVFSDCDSTVAAISCLQKGEPLKKPARYVDREDLLPRLQAVLAVRQVHVTRYNGGSLHHQDCHCRARRQLRDPKTLHRLALVRQRTRLAQLIADRESILNRLAKLDEEVSILQLQVASLELSSRMTDDDLRQQLAASQPVP